MFGKNDEKVDSNKTAQEQEFSKTRAIRINYPSGEKTTIIEFLDKGPIVVEDEPET